jgi:hypothetical protein
MTDEEKRQKRQKAVGREVAVGELPIDLRVDRLERIVNDLEERIKELEARDQAREISGMRIG